MPWTVTMYRADRAAYIGKPADSIESDRIAWVPIADLRSLIDNKQITSGTTLAALLYVLSEP